MKNFLAQLFLPQPVSARAERSAAGNGFRHRIAALRGLPRAAAGVGLRQGRLGRFRIGTPGA